MIRKVPTGGILQKQHVCFRLCNVIHANHGSDVSHVMFKIIKYLSFACKYKFLQYNAFMWLYSFRHLLFIQLQETINILSSDRNLSFCMRLYSLISQQKGFDHQSIIDIIEWIKHHYPGHFSAKPRLDFSQILLIHSLYKHPAPPTQTFKAIHVTKKAEFWYANLS